MKDNTTELRNYIAQQIKFHTISGLSEIEMLDNIMKIIHMNRFTDGEMLDFAEGMRDNNSDLTRCLELFKASKQFVDKTKLR